MTLNLNARNAERNSVSWLDPAGPAESDLNALLPTELLVMFLTLSNKTAQHFKPSGRDGGEKRAAAQQ